MEYSKNFYLVKGYYDTKPKLWDINRVHYAVNRWITEAEYHEITGFYYPDKELPTVQ